jgi:hypothetical protein
MLRMTLEGKMILVVARIAMSKALSIYIYIYFPRINFGKLRFLTHPFSTVGDLDAR